MSTSSTSTSTTTTCSTARNAAARNTVAFVLVLRPASPRPKLYSWNCRRRCGGESLTHVVTTCAAAAAASATMSKGSKLVPQVDTVVNLLDPPHAFALTPNACLGLAANAFLVAAAAAAAAAAAVVLFLFFSFDAAGRRRCAAQHRDLLDASDRLWIRRVAALTYGRVVLVVE